MSKIAFNIWPIERLSPFDGNPRIHGPDQIRRLRASIRTAGFIVPVVVDEKGMLLSGHGRVIAAKEEGLTELPVVQAVHLSELEKQAFILADNRLVEMGGWDFEQANEILAHLREEEFDLEMTGFDVKALEMEDEELDDVTSGDGKGYADPERDITLTVPEEHAKAVRAWLANGRRKTATGLGEGVLERMGLLAPVEQADGA